jgi:hypothetical protein
MSFITENLTWVSCMQQLVYKIAIVATPGDCRKAAFINVSITINELLTFFCCKMFVF